MSEKYYTYILKCDDNTQYIGHTNNLENRLRAHFAGRVLYTRNKQPKLVYFELFETRSQAYRREMQLKNGKTRKKTIQELILDFDQAKCQGFNSHIDLLVLRTRKSSVH